ncbi:DUF2497 domain-containing protein [Sphingosinithalassobacter sp. CS137]|uniref:DUF2497 domain-containing protein n=1 Tax=Sphingosinithalassobacter sp. CS137 TaxID=2762748 RepID=UPI00165D7ECE|nr:DUF2497 domain-containing protein [Sphingosinithalassobacter sp. CS137]
MGDISTEPSMEEILSSIKRIIAEEGEGGGGTRARRTPKAAPPSERRDDDEVLELNEQLAAPPRPARSEAPAQPAPQQADADESEGIGDVATAASDLETIVSRRAAEASRGSLEALSRMIVKPQTPGGDTLEGLVREMLRPMLSDWLDAHLPAIVEKMVAREIARITGREG